MSHWTIDYSKVYYGDTSLSHKSITIVEAGVAGYGKKSTQ